MINRTENGYAYGEWEGIPMPLEDGHKITTCEIRAAVCIASGLTYRKTAEQMHCSKANVDQLMQSLYYKLRCNRAIVAVIQLVDLGALRRIIAVLLIINAIVPQGMMRTVRTRPMRGGVTKTASRRGSGRGASTGLLAGMLHQLDLMTAGAGECYTAADVAPASMDTLRRAWRGA